MNINISFLGEIVFGFALIMGAICYYLGKQKGQNPYTTALLDI